MLCNDIVLFHTLSTAFRQYVSFCHNLNKTWLQIDLIMSVMHYYEYIYNISCELYITCNHHICSCSPIFIHTCLHMIVIMQVNCEAMVY